ncbi:MAG: hypothetical protein B7Y80_08725 [Hyphomicrobium sp. 32-62-53]|nr:MAG: hypothetical protein B7Z29_09900 [Hyphomicrobium sp. 12-62-95]OYX99984.1 MAG: hypothetical protein B7Y80_08725 [Hyphomicrobium sp. 32-62-53]
MKMPKLATSVAAIVLMAGPALATDKKFGGGFGGGSSGGAEISNEVGSFTQIGVNNAGVILQGATVDGEIDFEDSALGRADSLIDLGDLKQQSFNQIWTEGGSVGDTVAFSMDENDDEVFVGNRDVAVADIEVEDDIETLAIAVGASEAKAETKTEIETDIEVEVEVDITKDNIAVIGNNLALNGSQAGEDLQDGDQNVLKADVEESIAVNDVLSDNDDNFNDGATPPL